MKQTMRAIRGMNDIVPPATAHWQWLEHTIAAVLGGYGYREIRLPIVEHTGVFERTIGDLTDIVQKEMYTFVDRNGDSLTLRPEGTAGCARAVLENGLLQQPPQRLWYKGPMFRHERPQKGRYRQFHQIGVEVFGLDGPDIDAEIILLTARLWRALGLHDLRLEINTLGTSAERQAYRTELTRYFDEHRAALDAESLIRLERNPLRILDSKNPDLKPLIDAAPRLQNSLGEASRQHFQRLLEILGQAGIAYHVNPHLVRGLDYYAKTVFEWVTDHLGAQGTVCAGGRYDGLVELMGGNATPAIGFAMGLERLLELVTQSGPQTLDEQADVYVIGATEALAANALLLSETIRDGLPRLRTVCHCGGGNLKARMKKADRTGAAVALILGEDEIAGGFVTLKPLRGQGEQIQVASTALLATLSNLVANSPGDPR